MDLDFIQKLNFLWVNGAVKVVITVAGPHSHPYIYIVWKINKVYCFEHIRK